jgi:hypothetical protein
VSIAEINSFFGDAVDIRSLYAGCAVTAYVSIAQIISVDQHDIGFFSGGFSAAAHRSGGQI